MLKQFLLLMTLYSGSIGFIKAQDPTLGGEWKFMTGDRSEWADPVFNDSAWKTIRVGIPWERQGYANYDGFAWYRYHLVIPSSIRDKVFLKEKLRIDLGKIADGDEVYLNGFLIGQNAGLGGDIKSGFKRMDRSYLLSLDDPHIRWDKENVLAVRVWNLRRNGGMYEGRYGISVMDVKDFITLTPSGAAFRKAGGKPLNRKIVLRSSSEKYSFRGRLDIRITDPSSGAVVFKKRVDANFDHHRPFEYAYTTPLPESKAYNITYNFEDGASGQQLTTTEDLLYILTPPASATPRINGPEVYGVRPGAPLLYKIPATGQGPLTFQARGLPSSVHLDPQQGLLTGSLPEKGSYRLQLTVKNRFGIATRNFTLVCGEKIALTPALGWNSWNCWGLTVSDEKVRASADAMAARLAAHGWAYVNIDDGWEDKRDAQGEVLPNSKFPDMKKLCDYVHGLGLKMGIYSSPGPQTCGGYLGSYQHEDQDAATYARWGIDYLKYDWCSYSEVAPKPTTLDDAKHPFIVMRQSLDKVHRDIIYSLSQYGAAEIWKWGGSIGANSWRTTGDISDNWASLSGIGFRQDKSAPYIAPGEFNDPDMLVLGKVGWGPQLHDSRLSPDEQYTHISLWCLLSAPLLIGCDMSQLDDFTLGLLNNDEVLAVDQDPLVKPASKVLDRDSLQIWVKELKDGSKAVGIFNMKATPLKKALSFSELGLPSGVAIRDLWRQRELGHFKDSLPAAIAAHGVLLITVTGTSR